MYLNCFGNNKGQGHVQQAADSQEPAANESLGFSVIGSLRFAVIKSI